MVPSDTTVGEAITRVVPRSTDQTTCGSDPVEAVFSAYSVAMPGALKPPAANPRYNVLPSLLSAGVAWNDEDIGGWNFHTASRRSEAVGLSRKANSTPGKSATYVVPSAPTTLLL